MSLDLVGQAVDSSLLSKVDAPLGTYRDSNLTVAQFNSETLGTWMLCDGQDCSSTEYFTLTGELNVPDLITNGSFRRQAKSGRAIGSTEAQDFKSFTADSNHGGAGYSHVVTVPKSGTSGRVYAGASSGTRYPMNFRWDSSEVRPVNHACNVFIKVGHTEV
jgi:hypothetical protein